MATRTQTINDVRAMLDFLEANPELELPWFGTFNSFPEPEDIGKVAQMMAPLTKKTKGDAYYVLARKFGVISLEANFDHENVCERVVTGTKEIAEKITPAHTEDIVEWVCPDSLLNPA